MEPRSKQFELGIILIVAITAASFWFRHSRSKPEFNVRALPKHAPVLNEADVEKILGVEHFRVVRQVHQVPVEVRESFSNFAGLPFDLVDPTEEISSDDMTSGKSSRRLVFLGLSDDSAVLVYQQGGFADRCNALIFWYGDGGRGWAAGVDCQVQDISGLRGTIRKGDFVPLSAVE